MQIIEGTPIPVLFDLLLLVILFFIFRPLLFEHRLDYKTNVVLAEIVVLVFCVFAVWAGDWFHYRDGFMISFNESGVEDFYRDIVGYFHNYYFFRLVMWGVAFLCLKYTFKHIPVPYDIMLAIFCLGPLIWFSYARASFAMVLLLLGLVLISGYKNKIQILIGGAAICVTFFLHKSAFIGIAAVIMALIFSHLKPKISIILTIVSLPVLVIITRANLFFIIDEMLKSDSDMASYAERGVFYLESTNSVIGISRIILNFFEIGSAYIGAWLCVKLITSKESTGIIVRNVSIYVIIIVVFASVFTFDVGMNTSTLFGRILRFSYIPLVIPVAYCFENQLFAKLTKTYIYMALVSTFSHVLYSLYGTIL